MKKLLAVFAMLSMVGMAQAVNVWNIDWLIGGAYSPDDSSKGVLEDYSVTWSLMNETDNAEIASMTAAAGSDEIFVTDPYNGETLYYNSKLKPDDSGTYFGIAKLNGEDLTGTKNVYQYIFLDNGTDQYEWKSSVVPVTLSDSTMAAPVGIDSTVLLGKTTAWTKVGGGESSVPEPATMSLLGLGALAMVLRRKIRK